MSNLWFNIRFGVYHFQWERDSWYPTMVKNGFHVRAKVNDPNWSWFEVYCLFGKHIL